MLKFGLKHYCTVPKAKHEMQNLTETGNVCLWPNRIQRHTVYYNTIFWLTIKHKMARFYFIELTRVIFFIYLFFFLSEEIKNM